MRFLFILIGFFFCEGYAQTLSPRPQHPIATQHMLPGGESPGWAKNSWFEIEVIEANFWGAQTSFLNTKTNKTLTFTSDFEHTVFYLEYGKALNKELAFALEVPYYARHEGKESDQFINEFHRFFHFDLYSRNIYPYGGKVFETSTDGVRRGPNEAPSGMGNFKFKLKYWPIQWKRKTGLAFSLHTKLPIEEKEKGVTSGGVDFSALIHLAVPIYERSTFYFTAAGTYAEKNWMFEDWPRNKFLYMFDFLFDFSIGEKWGLLLEYSVQSPLIDKKHIQIQYVSSNPVIQNNERIASGYNSLAEFRGQEMLGLRRNIGGDDLWIIYILEDWNYGNKDHKGEHVYSNNQPDFGIGTKFIFNY